MIKVKAKAQTAREKGEKLKILAAGDFHGDTKVAKKLAEKAQKEKVDLVILVGDIIGMLETKDIVKPFIDKKQKVVFVPGNWETSADAATLSKQYNIKNLEENYVQYKDVGIFGIGSANWTLYPDEKDSFKKLKKDFDRIKNLEKKILVSHLHAAGTMSEISGFPGSTALRKAIEKFQPDLFICGHIHELEGIKEKVGKTKIINVGREGEILEI